jgi:hypothetical protein
VKTSDIAFNKLIVAKSDFVKLFLKYFAIFYTSKCIFGMVMPHGCTGVSLQKKGMI